MSNTRTITVEHDGVTYSGQLARIKSTSFGFEDHGILSVFLHCEWPSGGVGVGGYCLDESTGQPDYKRRGTAYGLDQLIRIMETVGVSSWEKLPGQEVIVLFPEGNGGWGGQSKGIAGTQNDKVLILKAHADAWLEADAAAVTA